MTELLVFGVNGFNPHIVLNHLDELPTIKKLVEERDNTTHGQLKSFTTGGYQHPHTGPAFTTMYTGVEPSKHGITEGGWRTGDSNFDGIYTIFDKLSEENVSMALYELIMGYPAKEVNGWMLSGFVSPPLESKFHKYYSPDSLEKDLPNDTYNVSTTYIAKKVLGGAAPNTDTEEAYKTLTNMCKRQLKIFDHVYKRQGDKDLVWFGTTLADKMGHVNGIRHDEKTIQTYQYIDYMLKKLIDITDPEDILIVSDHGFSNYSHDLYGYQLNTTENKFTNLYEIAPAIADYFDVEYNKEDYGEVRESYLSEDEKTK